MVLDYITHAYGCSILCWIRSSIGHKISNILLFMHAETDKKHPEPKKYVWKM
jgi:hypothetical protein